MREFFSHLHAKRNHHICAYKIIAVLLLPVFLRLSASVNCIVNFAKEGLIHPSHPILKDLGNVDKGVLLLGVASKRDCCLTCHVQAILQGLLCLRTKFQTNKVTVRQAV